MENGVKFTFSQIKYIIFLYRLSKDGLGVKNVELASALGFSKPSVHNMLKSLAELNVVRKEAYGLVFFTEGGRAIARRYNACYEKLERKIAEFCGNGAISENSVCVLLADMPEDKLEALYHSK